MEERDIDGCGTFLIINLRACIANCEIDVVAKLHCWVRVNGERPFLDPAEDFLF